jgi:hypothetical protein
MNGMTLPAALRVTRANSSLCARIGVLVDGVDMGARVVAYDTAIGWVSLVDGSSKRGVVTPYWRDQVAALEDVTPPLDKVLSIYHGSNADATRLLYQRLDATGPQGFIGSNLFRAAKCSERAKVYRRGKHKREAYGRKQWALDNLDGALIQHAASFDLTWGWALDPAQEFHNQVLYIELPTGQVSFHTEGRGLGPAFSGAWDGVRGAAPDRICRWIVFLLGGAVSHET